MTIDNTFRQELEKHLQGYGMTFDDLSPLTKELCSFSYIEGHSDGVHQGYQLACNLSDKLPKR